MKNGGDIGIHFYDENSIELTELYHSISFELSFNVIIDSIPDKKELILEIVLEAGYEASYSLSVNRINNSPEKTIMNNYILSGILYNREIENNKITVFRQTDFSSDYQLTLLMKEIEGNATLYTHYCNSFLRISS